MIRFSVSATTRSPRAHEQNGIHYHFLSKEEFQKFADEGAFLEWEEVYDGLMYGTLKSAVEDVVNSGYFCLLDIDVKGALNVKRQFADEALCLFIKAPSIQVLEQRLSERGTESSESLKRRLAKAREELSYAEEFDHIVVNEMLADAYAEVKSIIKPFIQQEHVR